MIELKEIHKSYLLGKIPIPALRGVSLKIEKGEFVAITGPSGSGKSTLLNIIGCLDRADAGSYGLIEHRVDALSDDELASLRNRRLGFVFQMFNLVPRINAQRNVELPLVYAGVSLSDRKRRARELLDRVGLEDRINHSPAQLSGGQQQRVAIARAIVNDPDIVIADEPTGNLDSVAGKEIMELLLRLNAKGTTIVMVTHEAWIARQAQRIVRLRDGMIESSGR